MASFVPSESRFCTLTRLYPTARPRIGHIKKYVYTPQVTIACKSSSTIARFKNTEFRTSDNQSTLIKNKNV